MVDVDNIKTNVNFKINENLFFINCKYFEDDSKMRC